MSEGLQFIKNGNRSYVAKFSAKVSALAASPAKRIAILTCMDARLDPAKYAGLVEGDAHIIRNAGGRASDDAIRSLVISYKLLGTKEWFVIHHTDCGIETFTSETMGDLLASSLKPAKFGEHGWQDNHKNLGTEEGKYLNWLTFTDRLASIVEDVKRIRENPMVPKNIPIYGLLYDCKSGKLTELPEATLAGKAQ